MYFIRIPYDGTAIERNGGGEGEGGGGGGRIRATNRIAMRLTPNYVLMKINRYICRSVVSLWAFPRITRTFILRPRSSSSSTPPPFPPSALSCYLRTPRHLFDSLKGIPVSICLFRFVPPSSASPVRTTWTESNAVLPVRRASSALRSKLNNQFQFRKNRF